ncbi:MAG: hypothetical protein GY703_18255 [Gammaproteobacteria bacterium]|nr:hypothetical protein [Gammaproteobacteria bacterium]
MLCSQQRACIGETERLGRSTPGELQVVEEREHSGGLDFPKRIMGSRTSLSHYSGLMVILVIDSKADFTLNSDPDAAILFPYGVFGPAGMGLSRFSVGRSWENG